MHPRASWSVCRGLPPARRAARRPVLVWRIEQQFSRKQHIATAANPASTTCRNASPNSRNTTPASPTRAVARAVADLMPAWAEQEQRGLTAPSLRCSTAQGRDDPGELCRHAPYRRPPLHEEAVARRHPLLLVQTRVRLDAAATSAFRLHVFARRPDESKHRDLA